MTPFMRFQRFVLYAFWLAGAAYGVSYRLNRQVDGDYAFATGFFALVAMFFAICVHPKDKNVPGVPFLVLVTLALNVAFPATTGLTRAFHATRCSNNLSELVGATMMYANDYDGTFPPSESWRTSMAPYSKHDAEYRCPDSDAPYTYAINKAFAGARWDDLPQWDGIVTLFEHDSDNPNASGGPQDFIKRHAGKGALATIGEDDATLSEGVPSDHLVWNARGAKEKK